MRQFGRVALGGDDQALAVDQDRAVRRLDFALEAAVDRIVAEQQRVGFRVAQVIDRDQLEIVILAFEDRAGDKPPDAPEAVDRNPGRHARFSC